MRIRQVKPAFWADAKLAELPEATRLFYIGLWMLADDAGWLRWNVVEAAHELYGYETRRKREQRTQAMYEALVAAERVQAFDCGHSFIPKLTDHQHLSGSTRRVETVKKEHQSKCFPQTPAHPRGDPPSPAHPRSGKERLGKERERSGQERLGKGAPARQTEDDGARTLPPFEDLVAGRKT
jgi:hypothetical protein